MQASKPVSAVTMSDPAGVGLEVVLKAAADPQGLTGCVFRW